ncbi:glycosyltransferase family 4 protein [Fervidicoccus fontis]|uniref:Glycosyltransferase, family 4 n=1 Tax=Fervidicoccus fontis (strain DSM 19380 / JCM 18336 / VKM B-2539 / Kam940) TaxID=1163730 RepID=I0A0X1_FERFK|nr:glycosyltransferase family 4 protein [Fervidicoccus fontis]AFH42628.1 glycosyltransferase, family 4 [Fervidicoccus fontis Kam940]
MKIAVIHDSLNNGGGAERLAVYMAKTLSESGYDVYLVTMEKTNWLRLRGIMGDDVESYFKGEVIIPYLKLPLSLYDRFNAWLIRDIVAFSLKVRSRYDLTIVTKQYGIPILADIAYIHFPDFYPGVESLYYPERYVKNTFLRIYSMPYRLILKALLELYKVIDYRPLILTNSSFSKAVIERWLRTPAIVLYPPVNVEKYLKYSSNKQRDNLVVSIGRIERAKGLHVIPYVAKETSGIKYAIVGLVSDHKYLAEINELIKKLNVEDKVKILNNLNEDKKLKILSRAKVYFHPMKYEHFGISIIEAMAAGLVPVVNRMSGSWSDIIKFGKYGLGCDGQDDCANMITYAVNKYDQLSKIATMRVRYFNYERFKDNLTRILKKFS